MKGHVFTCLTCSATRKGVIDLLGASSKIALESALKASTVVEIEMPDGNLRVSL